MERSRNVELVTEERYPGTRRLPTRSAERAPREQGRQNVRPHVDGIGACNKTGGCGPVEPVARSSLRAGLCDNPRRDAGRC